MIREKGIVAEYFKHINVSLLHGRYGYIPEIWDKPEHTLGYSKFYFICSGDGWLKIGDTEYVPKAGELYLLPAGTSHAYKWHGGEPLKKYFCHFKMTVGNHDLFDLVRMPHVVMLQRPEPFRLLFEQLLSCMHTGKLSSRLRVQAILLDMMAAYIEETEHLGGVALSRSGATELIDRVLNYIHDHLAEPLTVESLSAHFHFHPVYLSKLFKKHVQVTPKKYIYTQRLEKAKKLLLTTGDSISAIAALTGYPDVHYFSHQFRAHYGASPSEYRK